MFKFIGQLLAVYPLVCFIVFPFEGLYIRSLGPLDNLNGDPRKAFVAIIYLIAGVALGSITGVTLRSLVSTGRWIWTVPAPLLILSFGIDLWRSDPSKSYATVSHITMIYFYSNGDDEGLTSFLATFPAFAYLGYSAALWLVRKRNPRPA